MMNGGSWLKALCVALLAVIVSDIGFLVRVDSLSREGCCTLAAVTAAAGLTPGVIATYFIRAARTPN